MAPHENGSFMSTGNNRASGGVMVGRYPGNGHLGCVSTGVCMECILQVRERERERDEVQKI